MFFVHVRQGRQFERVALLSISNGTAIVRHLRTRRVFSVHVDRLKPTDRVKCYAIQGGLNEVNIVFKKRGKVQKPDQKSGTKDGRNWEINTAELACIDADGNVEVLPFEASVDLRGLDKQDVDVELRVVIKRGRNDKDAELGLKANSVQRASAAKAA